MSSRVAFPAAIWMAGRATVAPIHESAGEAAYHAARHSGIHSSTRTKIARPAARVGAMSRRGGAWAGRVADPQQPHDERIEHDERLPEVEMRPLEPVRIPLPEVVEAHDADHVQGLDRHEADRKARELPAERRRIREHPREQHEHRLDAVAA